MYLYAKGMVCGVDFNISHGGENDIRTVKHQQACKSACSSKKMDNFFVKNKIRIFYNNKIRMFIYVIYY